MTDTRATRPAPQLTRVPPPESQKLPRVLLVLASSLLIAAVAAAFFAPYPANLAVGACLAFPIFLFVPITWFNARRAKRQRAEMLAAFPALLAHPVAVRLDQLYRQTAPKLPKPEHIRAELRAGSTASPSAWIVCFGPMQIPDVGEMRFEPYIVSATAFLWRRLLSVPIALVVIAFWLLQVAHVVPGHAVNLGGFTYIIAVAVGTAVMWIWRGAIRPTYVRMAPGIIQVLEYGLRRQKPVIRTYRMEPGTLVLVAPWGKGLHVTLLRDGHKDVLPVASLRNPAEAIEHVWRALLSTAPIPHMSEEELIE